MLRLMQGEPVEDLSRRLAVPVWKLEEWRQRGLAGIDAGLRERDAERFIRTLKEQIVFGRIFQDIEEVRTAVRTYFDRYNQHWFLEKNGYRSPAETRRNWMAATIATHEAATLPCVRKTGRGWSRRESFSGSALVDLNVRLNITAAGAEADDHPLRGVAFVDRNELSQDEHVDAGGRDRSRGALGVQAHVLDVADEPLGESVRHGVSDLLLLLQVGRAVERLGDRRADGVELHLLRRHGGSCSIAPTSRSTDTLVQPASRSSVSEIAATGPP